jgi:long-chain acyl-CoA synthetase
LRAHPDVADAAVIGLPDRRLGAVPVAVVEARPEKKPTEAELVSFCKNQLLAYQVPARILVTSALPRNASMKISLPAIRAMFEAE